MTNTDNVSARDYRNWPVKELTPEQCASLLVHSHPHSLDRHKAYLLRLDSLYLSPEEAARIQALIDGGI